MEDAVSPWWVRDEDGAVTGPFSAAEVAALVRTGRIPPDAEISRGRLLWRSATTHPAFLLATVATVATATHPTPTATHPTPTATHPTPTATHPTPTATHPTATATHPTATATATPTATAAAPRPRAEVRSRWQTYAMVPLAVLLVGIGASALRPRDVAPVVARAAAVPAVAPSDPPASPSMGPPRPGAPPGSEEPRASFAPDPKATPEGRRHSAQMLSASIAERRDSSDAWVGTIGEGDTELRLYVPSCPDDFFECLGLPLSVRADLIRVGFERLSCAGADHGAVVVRALGSDATYRSVSR